MVILYFLVCIPDQALFASPSDAVPYQNTTMQIVSAVLRLLGMYLIELTEF